MAKCVVCTHLNSIEENKKHDNPTTEAVVKLLYKRRMNADPKKHPHKFCELHRPVFRSPSSFVPATKFGTKTGKFVQR